MRLVTEFDFKKQLSFLKANNAYFTQSDLWMKFQKKAGNLNTISLTLINQDNDILGICYLTEKKLFKNLKYYYAPRGFITDFNNQEIVGIFIKLLREFARKNNAIFIKIDPAIKYHSLDNNGQVLNNDDNNYNLVEALKKMGLRHFGFNKNFENSQPRYTFILPLKEDFINSYHDTTKKVISRGNIYNLEIKKDDNASIDDFYKTMIDTAKRENILFHDKEYYQLFYNDLKEMSSLYEIFVNKQSLLAILTETKNKLDNRISVIESDNKYTASKKDNLIKELNNQKNKNNLLIQKTNDINEEKIVLSSIITINHHDTVYTVHGGNSNLLRELNANYFIYHEIISDAYKNNYKFVDFFGTTGNPDKNNPIYGIHLFKKRFGGEYIEYIGEFDIIAKKELYFLFNSFIPLYRNIKRFLLLRKEK